MVSLDAGVTETERNSDTTRSTDTTRATESTRNTETTRSDNLGPRTIGEQNEPKAVNPPQIENEIGLSVHPKSKFNADDFLMAIKRSSSCLHAQYGREFANIFYSEYSIPRSKGFILMQDGVEAVPKDFPLPTWMTFARLLTMNLKNTYRFEITTGALQYRELEDGTRSSILVPDVEIGEIRQYVNKQTPARVDRPLHFTGTTLIGGRTLPALKWEQIKKDESKIVADCYNGKKNSNHGLLVVATEAYEVSANGMAPITNFQLSGITILDEMVHAGAYAYTGGDEPLDFSHSTKIGIVKKAFEELDIAREAEALGL